MVSFRWQLVVRTFDVGIVWRSCSLHTFPRSGTKITKGCPALSVITVKTVPWQLLSPSRRSIKDRYPPSIGRSAAVIRRWIGPGCAVIPRQTAVWPGLARLVGTCCYPRPSPGSAPAGADYPPGLGSRQQVAPRPYASPGHTAVISPSNGGFATVIHRASVTRPPFTPLRRSVPDRYPVYYRRSLLVQDARHGDRRAPGTPTNLATL
jgi:hypothetical protein